MPEQVGSTKDGIMKSVLSAHPFMPASSCKTKQAESTKDGFFQSVLSAHFFCLHYPEKLNKWTVQKASQTSLYCPTSKGSLKKKGGRQGGDRGQTPVSPYCFFCGQYT